MRKGRQQEREDRWQLGSKEDSKEETRERRNIGREGKTEYRKGGSKEDSKGERKDGS